MEVLIFPKIQQKLLKRLCKINNGTTRSVVDLAHKIYGNKLTSDSIPILTLHGLLGSKKNWQSMSNRIAEATENSVIAVDLRNHGESPHVSTHSYPELAADVNQLLTKFSISRATIIGHSMGGRTAMVQALTEPSKIASLIIVDVSPVSTAGVLNNFFPKLLDAMKQVKFPKDTTANAKSFAKDQLYKSGVIKDESTMNFVLMNVGKTKDTSIGWMCNVDALKENFTSIATFPPEMKGKQYKGPTLFIAGKESNYVPPSDITAIPKFFPEAQLKYVPNAGHNVHADEPIIFLELVTHFFKVNKLMP